MIGTMISHYNILDKIGEGGMGVVYRAHDTKLDRTVALKFLPAHAQPGEIEKERFIREAKAASALDHPNVCTVYEIDESDDGTLFISMAYYEGESLQSRLKRGVVELPEALDIAIQLAKGLHRAHESKITHRDIKPGNIMITNRGEVKIVDFGLAKLAGQAQFTKSGSTIGTAAYMSPEQVNNNDVDQRSDIFSFGIVLYEMVTGKHPFQSDYFHAMMYAITNDNPQPVTEINPDLPEELEWIINKTIEKNPGSRYQTIHDVLLHLEALRDGTIDTYQMPAGKPRSIVPEKRKSILPESIRKTSLIAAVIIVVALFLLLVLSPSKRQMVTHVFYPPSVPEVKQIAVLPFMNIGGNPENQAFCDGLVETLTSKLSQLEQFQGAYWVVPASETRSAGITSASEAHASFGVNLVITGSVQRLDRGVRVTINLIDAVTLRQLDSKIIDDIFIEKSVLQDEAVFKLAGMLNIELQPEARRILTAGGTTVPGAYEFYVQGKGHLQRFDIIAEIETAIELFRRALREDPGFALAYAALGDAHLYLYRHTEDVQWLQPALEYSQRAIEIDNALSPVYTTLGLLFIETGEYEEAHYALGRALEIDASNFEAYRGRARAFMAQQRINEAEATYRKAIEMKPGYWAGYAELGVFYSRYGKFDEAAEQFSTVIELTPSNASAYRNLGAMYYYLNRRDDAIAMFNKSVEIRPNYGVYANLGTMYYYDGNYDAAADMYSKALELNDTDYRVWSYLASAYKNSTPPLMDNSRDALRRAKSIAEGRLEVNPRDAGLLVSLASYNVDLDDAENAEEFLQRAIRMEPGEVNVLMNIAGVFEKLDKRTEAIDWLIRSIENGFSVEDINRNPAFNDLRGDARYIDFIQKHSRHSN